MQNLTDHQRFIAAVLATSSDKNPRYCALMRAAAAGTHADHYVTAARKAYPGLDVESIAIGWDQATGGVLASVNIPAAREADRQLGEDLARMVMGWGPA